MARFQLKTLPLRVLLTALLAACISEAKADTGVCEQEIAGAAQRYGVPEGILYSVGLTETGKRGSLQPWALNIDGRAVFASSPEMALRTFEVAKNQGAQLIDLGCMQINQRYHGENFQSVEAMIDPKKNVEYAAKFLAQLHAKHVTWTMAVARYHAGPNNDPAQKRYVCRVVSNLVATGYGQWTPAAMNFCSN